MIEYRCPQCRRMAFKAEGPLAVRVVVKCGNCKALVTPQASSTGLIVRTYRCETCGRTQTCVDPVDDKSYCIPCGTPSLAIVAEHRPEGQSPKRATPSTTWSSR